MTALKKTATITPFKLSKNVVRENPFKGIPDDAILAKAEEICLRRLRMPGVVLSSPSVVKSFLTLKLGHLEYECFTILCIDAKQRLIECVEAFRGSVTEARVYPREIIKLAMTYNAVSIIIAHNHPSGLAEPSRADVVLTQNLVKAMALIELDITDHIIIAGVNSFSFAEMGQMPS